ncbi:phenylalanine--tRNA ligase subunit alpha [Desulfurococcus amylolyticus]|uniref:phenylalanine--tRNA ligase subunit alpha n=1 Tax=Desulfurococcus amylolyticus TaxID=94694 RepID=UPI0006623799|nr:phenylalanine--tRNA ligase subunit alpha [Desulfurococcus amylolyticus]
MGGEDCLSRPVFLPSRQYRIVSILVEKKSIDINTLAQLIEGRPEDLMRDLAELEGRKLIRILKQAVKIPVLTSEAYFYLEKGMPEEQVYRVFDKCVNKPLNEFIRCIREHAGIPEEIVKIGLQYHLKSKCLVVLNGIVAKGEEEKCIELMKSAEEVKRNLELIRDKGEMPSDTELLRRRHLIELRDRTSITVLPMPELLDLYRNGLVREKEVLTIVKPTLTPTLDQYIIKEFDLSIEPPAIPLARKHPFMEFIDDLRDILTSMGFEEVKGPHVEAEFWNFDVLFQAQDHPAREIHDTFFLKTDLRAKIPAWLLERAGRIHEEGWRYKWSPERSLRLVLRSQTTAVSARAIYERGEGEYRVFTIDRNFRPENLDAKHSMEFHQLDGVIVGRDVNFKHLLYFFKELAAALGIKEVWFKPGYFPFTEPSVEGYIKHPRLGWVEVFPGGVFRPEVMNILGAPGVRAIAWGIGVDRLAMTVLGLNDIRLLFTRDLDVLENIKYNGLPFFKSRTTGREVRVVEYPY